MFSLYYKKNNNKQLFDYLEETGFQNPQNFFPLLSNFFQLDENNCNKINLNQKFSIKMIKETKNNNNFTISCQDEKNNEKTVESFLNFLL